jgi:hypothetical protein
MSKETVDKEKRKAGLAGAASAVLASKAPQNVLGYDKVHHGTSHAAAGSIKKTGLKKSKSGSGVAANDVALGRAKASDVKGKVYTTKQRATADLHQPNVFGYRSGQTLTARVPYRAKSRLAKDHVIENIANGTDNLTRGNKAQQFAAKMGKKHLRIYKHSISSRFIEGGKGYGGRKQFASKGNMRRYLSQAGGKARFAKGVAQAAGSVGSGLYAVAHAIKARKEAKK